MWKRYVLCLFVTTSLTGCAFVFTDDPDHSDEDHHDNTAPDARLTVDPTYPAPEQPFVLDASNSSDPDGDRLTYRFELHDADGQLVRQVTTSEPTTEFSIASSAEHEASVTVRDEHGAERQTSRSVEPQNRRPEVETNWRLIRDGEVVIDGKGGGLTAGAGDYDRLEVQVTRIQDPEGHDTQVDWVLDSHPDTAPDCSPCRGTDLSLELNQAGLYEGRIVVRDEYGAETVREFSVEKATP